MSGRTYYFLARNIRRIRMILLCVIVPAFIVTFILAFIPGVLFYSIFLALAILAGLGLALTKPMFDRQEKARAGNQDPDEWYRP